MSFFKGLGAGKYAAATKLKLTSGKPLSDETAQSPCLGDWDGDRDHDMVLGFIQGPYRLFTNNGDLTFTDAGAIKVNGVAIEAHDGGPCMVDWDGDGMLDLLLGDSEGNVRFYKGTEKGSLNLVADDNKMVIPKGGDAWGLRVVDKTSPVGFKPPRPGGRVKPFAADWNGDGKLDLLVGDYITIEKPSKKMTADQRKELEALHTQQQGLYEKVKGIYEAISEKAKAKAGMKDWDSADKATREKYEQIYMAMLQEDETYLRFERDATHTRNRIETLSPEPEGTGLVWVYLRK